MCQKSTNTNAFRLQVSFLQLALVKIILCVEKYISEIKYCVYIEEMVPEKVDELIQFDSYKCKRHIHMSSLGSHDCPLLC